MSKAYQYAINVEKVIASLKHVNANIPNAIYKKQSHRQKLGKGR
jgi:hypothetical protein